MPAQQKKVAKPKSSADVGCSSTSPTSVSSASAIPPYEGGPAGEVEVAGGDARGGGGGGGEARGGGLGRNCGGSIPHWYSAHFSQSPAPP